MAEEKDNEEEPLNPEEAKEEVEEEAKEEVKEEVEEEVEEEKEEDADSLEEGEDNEGDEDDEDADKPLPLKSNRKKILLIVIPVIVIIVALVVFYIFVLNKQKAKDVEGLKPKIEDIAKSATQNTYLDLELMTISLLASSEESKHMRIGITIRIDSEEEKNVIISKEPVVKDAILGFLRSLRAEDFNSSRSTLFLKEELTKRINKISAPVEIKEILFREIVIK